MLLESCEWPGKPALADDLLFRPLGVSWVEDIVKGKPKLPRIETDRLLSISPPPAMTELTSDFSMTAREDIWVLEERPSFAFAISPGVSRLFWILKQTASFQCGDPRDKLYAILPLFQSPAPLLLRPHYGKSVEEVFADLTWFLLDHNISGTLELAQGVNSESTLPSWVVDWRSIPRDDRLAAQSQQDTWSAGFAHGHRRLYASRHRNTLTIRGFLLGSVKLCWGSRTTGMRFMTTHEGRQGQAVGGVAVGDLICIFLGCRAPFLVRPHGEDLGQLVGECVVDGVMQCEALTDLDWTLVSPLRDFSIV